MNAINHPIKRSFVFFLVPDFTMVAFATALDPLRLANRMLGYEAYKWRLASFDGRPVRASNGVECAADTSLEDERRKMAGPERPSHPRHLTRVRAGALVHGQVRDRVVEGDDAGRPAPHADEDVADRRVEQEQ